MSDKPDRKRFIVTPSPALLAEMERQRKVRQSQIDAMMLDAKDG